LYSIFSERVENFLFNHDDESKLARFYVNFFTRSAIKYNRACEEEGAAVKMTKKEMISNIEARLEKMGKKVDRTSAAHIAMHPTENVTKDQEKNFIERGMDSKKWTQATFLAFIGFGIGSLVYIYCRVRNYKGNRSYHIQFSAWAFLLVALLVGGIGSLVNIGMLKSDLSSLSESFKTDFA